MGHKTREVALSTEVAQVTFLSVKKRKAENTKEGKSSWKVTCKEENRDYSMGQSES